MSSFSLASYDFSLPEVNIAQKPAGRREESRLLHVDMVNDTIADARFPSIVDLLQAGDVLVVNDTRVFPARLLGKKESGGRVEFMLLHYPKPEGIQPVSNGPNSNTSLEQQVEVYGLLKSSKRPRTGSRIIFGIDLEGEVVEKFPDGTVSLKLQWNGLLDQVLSKYGNVPLPPYIRRDEKPTGDDRRRYQTVYAKKNGAIAAPTAGLHFTDSLLSEIGQKGVTIAHITLHVGYGTFSPVRVDDIRDHKIHAEYVTVPRETVEAIRLARNKCGKVWAVGTTTTRALEFAADGKGGVHSVEGPCSLYMYPGYTFQVVDNLITNFHLPRSSLLFMVSAFAGKERVLGAYQEAIKRGYRFYSYGDAMVITR